MPKNWTFLGLLALIFVISAGLLAPASAEFFGCNDQSGQVSAVYGSSGSTDEFATQSRPRTFHRRHARRIARPSLRRNTASAGQ